MKILRWQPIVLLLLTLGLSRAVLADVYIIVNVDNASTALSPEQVERIFMLKAKRFDNGDGAEPVSQYETARVRTQFNEKILGRNEQQLKYYWSRKMFSGGDRPPTVVGTDVDVEDFVAENTGGIGYLSVKPTDKRVKTVLVIKE